MLRILEQVMQFNYLGCELSLDGEPSFDKKIDRFQGICGTIRKHLKKTRTDTQIIIIIIFINTAIGWLPGGSGVCH